MREYCC